MERKENVKNLNLNRKYKKPELIFILGIKRYWKKEDKEGDKKKKIVNQQFWIIFF